MEALPTGVICFTFVYGDLQVITAFKIIFLVPLFGCFSFWAPTHQIFHLISSFLCNRQLQVVLDGKSSQEYLVNARVPQEFIFGPTFFLLYMNGHPDDVICNITIYADDTNVYSKCDQASDLWEQLELASELESHL